MDIYKKVEKIVDIILSVYPMARLFKNKIMKKIQKVPASTLKRIISEIKKVLEKE
jgi:hypothetical protein